MNKNEVHATLRNDVLLVGLCPAWETANYEGQGNKPPFHGPTRRDGHIRATRPEDWTPETLLQRAQEEAAKRGWKLVGTEKDALMFLRKTYFSPNTARGWWGTYGVLWYTVPEETP